MNKAIVFSLAIVSIFLMANSCSTSPKKVPAIVAPITVDDPINTFSISQEPVKKPVKTVPVPEVSPTSSATTTPAVSQGVKKVNISIKNFEFTPAVVEVNIGDEVVWTNSDAISHSINSTNFNSPLLESGATFSQKFTTAGTYDYACSIHPSMAGKIIVK